MAARNKVNVLLAAFASLIALPAIQPHAIAAEPDRKPAAAGQDARMCKRYVHERKGHPAKGVHRVKVVYVPCKEKK